LRYRIPMLSGPKVNVVDAKEIHVFDVPRESRAPHAEIKVRCVHTWQAIR